MIPLINGISYSWGQIAINLFGLPIAGVTAISYSETQDIVNHYGAGNFPVSRGFGKVQAGASLTLLMEEVENITAQAPGKRLQNIPEFDVIVTFLPQNGLVRTHKLRNCRFGGNHRNVGQGDTKIEVSLELIVSHIEW